MNPRSDRGKNKDSNAISSISEILLDNLSKNKVDIGLSLPSNAVPEQ